MRWILTLAVLLLASPAGAGDWFNDCKGTAISSPGTPTEIQGDRSACYDLGSGETAANGDSTQFDVSANSALICLDNNTGSASAGTGGVTVRLCTTGTKPAANPTFTCEEVGTELVGAWGNADTQTACVRVGPGTYYLDVTTDMSHASRVRIQGESKN